MTYLSPHPENFEARFHVEPETASHRRDSKLEPTTQTLLDTGVETDNLDSIQDEKDILALSAVQSAEEFNDAYGDQQEEHFRALFDICWSQYQSDEQTYEDWFKVFQNALRVPQVANPLSTVKKLKALEKAQIAKHTLETMEPITVEVEVDGETLTKTVDIAQVMKDNEEELTSTFLYKNAGILGKLATVATTDEAGSVNVERKLKAFFNQDESAVNKKRSLSAVAGAGKNGIKADKNKGGGAKKRSPLTTAQNNLRLIADADWQLIVVEFADKIKAAQEAIS